MPRQSLAVKSRFRYQAMLMPHAHLYFNKCACLAGSLVKGPTAHVHTGTSQGPDAAWAQAHQRLRFAQCAVEHGEGPVHRDDRRTKARVGLGDRRRLSHWQACLFYRSLMSNRRLRPHVKTSRPGWARPGGPARGGTRLPGPARPTAAAQARLGARAERLTGSQQQWPRRRLVTQSESAAVAPAATGDSEHAA